MSRTLILSATITPPSGVPNFGRFDPALRLRDYLDAFEFYLKLPNDCFSRIVIADNSNSDVSALQAMGERLGQGKEIHVLSFDGLDHPASYGRGYGELKLMDRVVDEYEPIAKLPPETIVWKGTGRYKLLNIAKMIRKSPEPFDFYFDQRTWPVGWFDMRFFAFSLAGYRRILRGRYQDLREDLAEDRQSPGATLPEMELRKAIVPHLQEKSVIPRFNMEPVVAGLRGFDGSSYLEPKSVAKLWLRKVSRAVAPGIWV